MNGEREERETPSLRFQQIAVGVIPARNPTAFPGVFLYGLDHDGVVWGYEPRGNAWFRVPMHASNERHKVGDQA